MPSKRQTDFFDQLLDEKDFGENDANVLREQFADLSDSSASSWIESAISLSKKDRTLGKDTPAPF